MGFRFHKAFRLLPGIKLNMSKSGPSVSVGGKGLTYNFGGKKDRATVGLPGTGMSYQTTSSGRSKKSIFSIIVMVLAVAYGLASAATGGKFSLAHWTDLLSTKQSTASKENAEEKTADNEDAAPAPKHKRHHRKAENVSAQEE